MKATRVAIRSLLLLLLLGVAAVVVTIAFPSQTSAAEVSVQTSQLLPPGGNTCQTLQVSGFTPYVYDNALNSFEFTLPDSSYVAILGSVGNTSIPFQLMTRRIDASGALHVHVDIATTPVVGTLPISVTLLSAKGSGQPVCISVITTSIQSAGGSVSKAPTTQPVGGVTKKPVASTGTATTTVVGTLENGSATLPIVGSTESVLKNLCSGGVASVLGIILLAIYALLMWLAISAEKPWVTAIRPLEWTAVAIIVPLILLLGLWYFPESCRAQTWVPVVGILIALGAIIATYKNHPEETGTKTIPLPAAHS